MKWPSGPRTQSQKQIRDITTYLPAGTPEYPPEEVLRFRMGKPPAASAALLGDGAGGEVSLVGSSFSGDWTAFPDALRFTAAQGA